VAVRRTSHDEVPEIASALRLASEPLPPYAPIVERLAHARGYAQLDLADALCAPFRRDSRDRERSALPLANAERLDDAVEQLPAQDAPAIAAAFRSATSDRRVQVRAAAAVFAAHADPGLATAVALQKLADEDPDPTVRTLARAILEKLARE
jgi:hypothetical protein